MNAQAMPSLDYTSEVSVCLVPSLRLECDSGILEFSCRTLLEPARQSDAVLGIMVGIHAGTLHARAGLRCPLGPLHDFANHLGELQHAARSLASMPCAPPGPGRLTLVREPDRLAFHLTLDAPLPGLLPWFSLREWPVAAEQLGELAVWCRRIAAGFVLPRPAAG